MSTQILDVSAVYEHGVFRPLPPFRTAVPEGQQVRLIVETAAPSPKALVLATQVYDGLSAKQIDEIEQIVLDRRNFFGDRAPTF